MAARPMFYLIDGHALAYRQYFGLPLASFTTRAGEPTNATFGFARTLLDIMQKEKPKYLAVSFDMGLSGRDQLFDEYKGTRDKMPDELDIQIERIQQMVAAFNIPILAVEGYEADDVMGTIVQQAEAQGVDVRIVTGDRDILQLLTPHVSVQIPQRGNSDKVYTVETFVEDYGLQPTQLIDLKALMGDSSDNIPGVKGIGEKGGTKLLQEYGTLENIYAHIDVIKGATQKKLIEGREMAFISRDLATIRRDVPIELDLNACVTHDYDVQRVHALFAELEFRTLRDRLPSVNGEQLSLFGSDDETQPAPETSSGVRAVIVRDEAALQQLVETLNNAEAIVWDVETTSTDQMAADLVGVALAVDGETGYYVPVGHNEGTQLPLETVINALRKPLTDPKIPKYAHNASYDLVVMQRYGIDVSPITFDTMIAEWVRDPASKFLGLKNFVRQYLNIEMQEIKELIGSGRKQITMAEVDISRAAPYAADDAALTYRAVEYLRPEIAKLGLSDLYEKLELPFIPVIAAIERAGVVLDTNFLAELSEDLDAMLKKFEQEIYDLSDGYGTFNINSPKQLNDVLFGKLGLPTKGIRKTKLGYSTDAAVLDSLKNEHPIIQHILDYREVAKLKGTYVDALPALINPRTGRVHTSYNQTGSSTGRLSSSNPNLQNIPIRTELGREVRRAFIAPEGMKLLSVDYSQVELRVLAHISQDETLLEAFRQGQDIHAATAAAVNNIPLEEVTYEQRSFAKRVNFGLIYGMGAYRLARDSDLTLPEAEAFIKTYFERLPRVRDYIENTKKLAREQGYLTTLFGRRRYFPVLQQATDKSNQTAVRAAERVAINMPIQGTAADIIKQAMITLYDELAAHKLATRMILQVHDELVLEVPHDEVDAASRLVVDVMENAFELDAPLKANAAVGDNWRDMEALS
ncbi:MAG: DNA polymerase I [Chloroflexi bacterium]|nr:MAG: DNA polymerase I [Chloroflexota bacterium]